MSEGMRPSQEPSCVSRRRLMLSTACGFGYVAFADLAARAALRVDSDDPLAARPPMLPGRAKRVIFLFMHGGPSHVDTFDHKPRLNRLDGKTASFDRTRFGKAERQTLLGSPWKFERHGQSGRWVSSLFPHVAKRVDDLCMIHSMNTNGTDHGQATLFMHTGATSLIRPSVGSWVCYGLGTENENLPGFVTICPNSNIGGSRAYSSAFLPAAYQGTALGRAEHPATEAVFRNVVDTSSPRVSRARRMELLRNLNQIQVDGQADAAALHATVNSFETAFRMQQFAPSVTSLDDESAETLALYGVGQKETDDFARQCLLARRLSEAGVRFVQVNYTDNKNTPKWDQHQNLKEDHEAHARAVDQPIAALLSDLKRRGLLDDTLVWFSGEFGRTPYSESGTGRDHNPFGFTTWLAGGGVKAGANHGCTDDLGMAAAQDKVHTHDLHATLLRLLGLDHLRLTYRYAGRDFRLTDVAGEVIQDVIA